MHKSVMILTGLRRGGTHAVANWIRGCWDEPSTVIHCPLDFSERTMAQINYAREFPHVVIMCENMGLDEYQTIRDRFLSTCLDFKNVPWTEVMVIRDFRNQLASFTKKAQERPDAPVWQVDIAALWEPFAKEACAKKIVQNHVLFDKWFSSKAYRRSCAKKLGLTFSDTGLNEVTPHGGGSSFDGCDFDGKGQEMDVLNRYKLFEKNKKFQAVMDVMTPLNERVCKKFNY